MTLSIGVDPGIQGAIALVSSSAGLLEHANLPTRPSGASPKAAIQRKLDARALYQMVDVWSRRHRFAYEHVRVVIERMGSFGPKDKTPPGSLLSMGFSAGLCEGVLSPHASEPVLTVPPRTWKARFGLTNDKTESAIFARRLFPTIGRIRHDQAEAILLAAWGLGEVAAAAAAAPADNAD